MAQNFGIFERLDNVMKRTAIVEMLFWESTIPSGLNGFDTKVGGFRPGELVVLASEDGWLRPKLTQVFIESCAIRHNLPVVVVRLGYGSRDWCAQLFKSKGAVPWSWGINATSNTEPEWKCLEALLQAPIYVTEPIPGSGIEYLDKEIEKLADALGGLGLIIIDGIDYLNIWEDTQFNTRNPGASWSVVSSKLKWMAINRKCPVIIDTKVENANPDNGRLSEPTLRNLSYEGAIANSADHVLMLHDISCVPDGHSAILRTVFSRSGLGAWVDLHYSSENHSWREIEPIRL